MVIPLAAQDTAQVASQGGWPSLLVHDPTHRWLPRLSSWGPKIRRLTLALDGGPLVSYRDP